MMVTKMWSDPEIDGRLMAQAMHLFADQMFGPEAKDAFYSRHLFPVMHKMTAMKYHLDQYTEIESRLYLHYLKVFQRRQNENAECFELIVHFEAFMLQMKSSLDMLIKIMTLVPLRHGRTVKTRGYGDDGNQLIRSLKEQQEEVRAAMTTETRERDEVFIARLQALVDLAEDARDSWLAQAVEIRDQIAHTQGARQFVFLPTLLPNGKFHPLKPVFQHRGQEKPPVPLMEDVYRHAIEFHQDFIARAMHLGADLPFELGGTHPEDVAHVAEQVELTRFRGHPGRGVYGCHGATEAAGVHQGVQG